jgi:hypothetical protein
MDINVVSMVVYHRTTYPIKINYGRTFPIMCAAVHHNSHQRLTFGQI